MTTYDGRDGDRARGARDASPPATPGTHRTRRLTAERWAVLLDGTADLQREERDLRRRATSGERLGRALLTRWVAIRGELRRRGRRVPPPDRAPRSTWRRALDHAVRS